MPVKFNGYKKFQNSNADTVTPVANQPLSKNPDSQQPQNQMEPERASNTESKPDSASPQSGNKSNIPKPKIIKEVDLQPQSFAEIFGNQKTIASLKAYIALPNTLQNIIFVGEDGCGKSTFARLLFESVLGEDWALWVNQAERGSSKGIGIDASSLTTKGARDKLKDFLNGAAINKSRVNFKICAIENIDEIPKQEISEFSCWMDRSKNFVRFLFTCKDKSKISDMISKKCVLLPVTPLSDVEMMKMLKHLAGKLKVEFTDVQLNELCLEAKGIPGQAVNSLYRKYVELMAQQMALDNSGVNSL